MDDFKKMLDVYDKVLLEHLIPSAILPHLATWIDRTTINEIVVTETSNRIQACRILLSSLQNCTSVGIYRAFIHALREAEFPFLADALEGHIEIYNKDILKNFLELFYPTLYKDVDPYDITPSLLQSNCITPEDEETILAVQQSKGRPLAILVLLCTVVKRRESWFPCLMMAMKDQGRYRHIVEQIDADILSAEKLEDVERIAFKIKETNSWNKGGRHGRYSKCPVASSYGRTLPQQPETLKHTVSCPDEVDSAVTGAYVEANTSEYLSPRKPCERLQSLPSIYLSIQNKQSGNPEQSTQPTENPNRYQTLTMEEEEKEEWFHGNLDRETSSKIIEEYGKILGDGTFLVRKSRGFGHSFTLVVYKGGQVYHVPVCPSQQRPGALVLGSDVQDKTVYASLSELISGYKQAGITLATFGGQQIEGSVTLKTSPPKSVDSVYSDLA